MRDVDALIPPGSGLQLTNAFNNNERGEIVAKSFPIETTPNDDADLGHLVLLIPCEEEEHEGGCSDDDCADYAAVRPPGSVPATTPAVTGTRPEHPSWRQKLLLHGGRGLLSDQGFQPRINQPGTD
jgi:hypothetical protein